MLKTLFGLQAAEAELNGLREEEKHSADLLSLREVKAAFEVNKAAYQQLKEEMEAMSLRLDQLPAQLKETEAKRDAEQAAIYNGTVTSQKALSAREAQAAALTARLEQLQSQERDIRDQLDSQQAALAELKGAMESQYREFRRLKAVCQGAEEQRQQRIAQLEQEAREIAALVSPDELAWFRKEQPRFGGSPIAVLGADQVCGGCHTMVTSSVFARTVRGHRTACENCRRILFIDD